MQDSWGPRWVAALGGVLVGIGLIVASFFTSVVGYVIGFGLLAGAGIGFGYASATPPAVKWFSKARTGLIAGIVVSGFGLASVYTAPLARALVASYGLQGMMLIFGIAFFVVVVGLSQLLKPPPAGYVPPESTATGPSATYRAAAPQRDFTPGEVLRVPHFWLLWVIYAIGAGAGLMIIGKMAKIVGTQAGLGAETAAILVSVLAIGNGSGRILTGMLSDRIGRFRTLLACLTMQAVLLVLLSFTMKDTALANVAILSVFALLLGANYGSNLAIFPAIAKDWFGLKNFGVNYGLLFTAWGVGGFIMSLVAGATWNDQAGSFGSAYYLAAALLVIGAIVTQVVKPPKARMAW
jgi:nitrate/nitrite transporter NarK